MKKSSLLLFYFLFITSVSGQVQPILKLTSEQIEGLFIRQNLQLISEKCNISMAEAAIAQAKLWDNPGISLGNVNLWSTSSQRGGESEVIPPLFGSFGKNTEFSVELSQLIQTANKRGRLVNREKVSKEMAVRNFEEVLSGLRTELRRSMDEIIYLQSYSKILIQQESSLDNLIGSYKKQVQQGNLSKMELLRLQSSLLELNNEMNEVQTELNARQRTLKVLLNADPLQIIEIESGEPVVKDPDEMTFSNLFELASENRPDLQLSRLKMQYDEKNLSYEKAMRVPDLNFSVSYDRAGGVWNDFIGFGVSFDLPVFNRNQGNIKAAQISIDQNNYLNKQQINVAQQEIIEAYNNYIRQYRFYNKTKENTLFAELDNMLDSYARGLLNRNISMLEYIDFMDTYKSNKQTMLLARKNLAIQFEELQFTVGTSIK